MNILLTVFGWLAWNFGLFNIEKDKADAEGKDFSITHYIKCYWDNWIFSLIFVPVLIIVGIKGLDLAALPMLDFNGLKWQDSYYFGAGVFAEAFKYVISVVRKKFMS